MQVALVLALMTASLCLASSSTEADWIIYQEDFDGFDDGNWYGSADAEFENEWEFSPLQEGGTRIFNGDGDLGGMVILDNYYDNLTSSLNEAILAVNLPGYMDVALQSDPSGPYDSIAEVNGFGTWPFDGRLYPEGVSVSSDGMRGSPLIYFSPPVLTWENSRASLSDLFAAVPVLDLRENFPFQLQQPDNSFRGLDGRTGDNVPLESAQRPHLPEPDAVTLFGLGLLCLAMSCVRRRAMG